MSGYDEEDMYEQEYAAQLNQVASVAAQQAASLTAQQMASDNSALATSQATLTAKAIDDEMRAAYPDTENSPGWDSHKGEVLEVIQRNPHLLPQNDNILDPAALRRSLEDAYELARGVKADRYAGSRWQQIMDAPPGKLGL